MAYTQALVAELEILALFNLDNCQEEGIKVHPNATPEAVAATRRLYDKGLISRPDGGYLTSLGLDAAEQAQNLLIILAGPRP